MSTDNNELTTGEKLDILRNPTEYGRAGSGRGNNTTEGADRGKAVVKTEDGTYTVDLGDGSVSDPYGDIYTSA